MNAKWAVLAMLAWLSGCATLAPAPAVAPVTYPFIASFQVTGRIAVRHDQDGFSGNITWRHTPLEDTFVILAPLGQGIARITKNAEGVMLETADGKVRHAADAETLTEQALGFRLPLAGLPYWVQGKPVSDAAVLRYNSDGLLDFLGEQGWQIDYLGYRPVGSVKLPGKVFMEGAKLSLRLLIDDWQVPAP
ncbi:MAG: lipoprotein insertase outer membrane protein LolB [Burkholderiales bacterium]